MQSSHGIFCQPRDDQDIAGQDYRKETGAMQIRASSAGSQMLADYMVLFSPKRVLFGLKEAILH